MTDFDKNRIIQIVLYVLNKTDGIDYYHLFKILYFAERKHLAKWGCGILPDEFYALRWGPVPTVLYDAVKGKGELSKSLFKDIEFAGDDASNVLIAKKEANIKCLSKSMIEVLDASIAANAGLTFEELKNKSHDDAWKQAYLNSDKLISPINMAIVEGADSAMQEYIEDQLDIDKLLKVQ